MPLKKKPQFYMVYRGLVTSFSPAEAVFMAYMNGLVERERMGYNPLLSKQAHMGNMGIGLRVFDKCVEKCTRMGLLKCEPAEGNYIRYIWNTPNYRWLIDIVSANRDCKKTREFCDRMFEVEGRSVDSVSFADVEALKKA